MYDNDFLSDNVIAICKVVDAPIRISSAYIYDTDQGTDWIEDNH